MERYIVCLFTCLLCLYIQRIPLRGQEGMSVDQIEAFERAGYKMSANHKRQVEAHYMRMERKVSKHREYQWIMVHIRFTRQKRKQCWSDVAKAIVMLSQENNLNNSEHLLLPKRLNQLIKFHLLHQNDNPALSVLHSIYFNKVNIVIYIRLVYM